MEKLGLDGSAIVELLAAGSSDAPLELLADDGFRQRLLGHVVALVQRRVAVEPMLYALENLHFADGQYARAVPFAERAVRQAPGNASYRIKLGDAYYKVLRYPKARMQYEQAKKLGHKSAQRRLDKLP